MLKDGNALDIRNIEDLLNCKMLTLYVWLEPGKFADEENGYWLEISNPNFEITMEQLQGDKRLI